MIKKIPPIYKIKRINNKKFFKKINSKLIINNKNTINTKNLKIIELFKINIILNKISKNINRVMVLSYL